MLRQTRKVIPGLDSLYVFGASNLAVVRLRRDRAYPIKRNKALCIARQGKSKKKQHIFAYLGDLFIKRLNGRSFSLDFKPFIRVL